MGDYNEENDEGELFSGVACLENVNTTEEEEGE